MSMDGHSWESRLKADPTEWLLGEDNPSVRSSTLTDVLERGENHPDVAESRRATMRIGPVPAILAEQKSGGYWGVPENFYAPGKFRSSVWQLMILAELGADPEDERVKRACEFILDVSQDRESGGFAWKGTLESGGNHGG